MEPTPPRGRVDSTAEEGRDLLQLALEHHVVLTRSLESRISSAFHRHRPGNAHTETHAALREVAPSVRVDLGDISESTPRFGVGAVDLAVGFILPMGCRILPPEACFKENLCARVPEPSEESRHAELEQFRMRFTCNLHIWYWHGIVERTLESKGIKREVGLTVPSFLELFILASTDYLVTLPGSWRNSWPVLEISRF